MGTISECEKTLSLTDMLHEAGVSCRKLRDWEACADGKKDLCITCSMDGPVVCDMELVKTLVSLVVLYAGYTDQALQQSDYWQNVSSKLADRFMERDRAAIEQE
jgi:hypothetical protein